MDPITSATISRCVPHATRQKGIALELFYPPDGRGRVPDWATPAAVCAACPVIAVCRADVDAMEANADRRSVVGFRAGETATQRYDRRKAGRIGKAA
ncbi:MAG: hypothetical protein P8M10_01035 [Ilumatobacter sp.]|nr:hypothetical protein [Ilumatobacter sp.]MDG2437870.1 hypothetical protein [Ilumatobacter sp.]